MKNKYLNFKTSVAFGPLVANFETTTIFLRWESKADMKQYFKRTDEYRVVKLHSGRIQKTKLFILKLYIQQLRN